MAATVKWLISRPCTAFYAVLLLLSHQAIADKVLSTSSLSTCAKDSGFSASLFKVTFTPENGTLDINIMATSTIQGKVIFDLHVWAYGFPVTRQIIDPCNIPQTGLCPMTPGKFNHPFRISGNEMRGAAETVPAIAYNIPDLDATARAYINLTATGESVACIEADISNGKTVSVDGVKWATATFIGVGLLCSAVTKRFGHTNAAAHGAVSTLAIFAYFQSQSVIGLLAVHIPPIAQSWTQNFQWSLGIVRIGWMQRAITWYQRSTGGRASGILDALGTVSVQVLRRELNNDNLHRRDTATLSTVAKRNSLVNDSGSYVVTGIQRVAFRAGIEITNLFMTGVTFFYMFTLCLVLILALSKGLCELGVRRKLIDPGRASEFRLYWLDSLKGIIMSVCLVGLLQISTLCLWELAERDSPAEVVLAVGFLMTLCVILAFGTYKTLRTLNQTRKDSTNANPAYGLFADVGVLNKFGPLYIQYRASASYFIIPSLIRIVGKAMLVALGQNKPIAQAIALMIIEVGFLIAASVIRPWMDKGINSFHIAISVVDFLNSVLLFIFCNVFSLPTVALGVIGVVLFILNAAFSLILIIYVIASTAVTLFRKDPDGRYYTMADDRTSFMKSRTQIDSTFQLHELHRSAQRDIATDYPIPLK